MHRQKATITEMYRYNRWIQIQNEFIKKYQQPVISFCINIPDMINPL